VVSNETGLKISANKTKYMFMSRDQNAGRNHGLKNYYISVERVEEFKYLGTNLINQKVYSGRNQGQIEIRECLLSFCGE
jgi:hypothetical protein